MKRALLTRGDVIALGAIAACLLGELALLPVGLDDMDEGYFAEQATRVLRGELPYRDFDSLYTPGLLYLHAGLFAALGGPHVLTLRLVSFVARVGLAVGLYGLARPLARPLWAALPALYLLIGLDRSPVNWEPHPGWESMLCTVVAVWLFARLPTTTDPRRQVWLGLIGVLTALVFAHKQNAGVFLGLATSGFLFLRGTDPEPRPVTPLVRVLQLLTLGGVLAGLGWLVHPHPYADGLLFAYLVGPVAAACLLTLLAVPVCRRGTGLIHCLAPLLPLGGGFALAILPWLLALLVALDWQVASLRGFVGGVNLLPLSLPIELPKGPAWTAVLGLGLAAVASVWSGRYAWPLLLAATFGASAVALTREPNESLTAALLLAPGRAAFGLQAFLPIAAIVAGVWLARRQSGTAADWRLRWYIVAGALTFLTQYPRLDNFHLLWSACLPLVVGAIALDRLHTWLAWRWQRGPVGSAALAAALLVVPLLSALPTLYVRGEGFLKVDPASGVPLYVPLVPIQGVLAVDGLFVPEVDRDQLAGVVRYLRDTTAPGEQIFVYPTSPLIYVAAERPNPTRFSHLYPGGASSEELRGLIVTLETARVRTLVISDGWLFVWWPPGDNALLEEYLGSRYQNTARFGTYRVLVRRGFVEGETRTAARS